MGVTLYHCPPSPPSRAAFLVAKLLGINFDVKNVDLFSKEHLKPEYLKINPQHTVPALADGDFVVVDSHAIGAYLVTKYGKDDSLYPKDPKKRALVDQRLFFECGTLFPRLRAICFPILFLGKNEIPEDLKTSANEALGFVNMFLEGNDFVAGKSLTIADCSLIATISSLAAMGWDFSPYGNIKAWMARCAAVIPDYQKLNQEGAEQLGNAVKSKLAPGQL